MIPKEILIHKENKALAKYYAAILADKINPETFLNIFNDKYNWFAALGLSEEDYQKMAFNVKLFRDVIEKEFNKIFTDENNNKIAVANTVIFLDSNNDNSPYNGFYQLVGNNPELYVLTNTRTISLKFKEIQTLSTKVYNKKINDIFEYLENEYQIKNIWTLKEFQSLLLKPDKNKEDIESGDIIVVSAKYPNIIIPFYYFFQMIDFDDINNSKIDCIKGIDKEYFYTFKNCEYYEQIQDLDNRYQIENIIAIDTFTKRFDIPTNTAKSKLLIKNIK